MSLHSVRPIFNDLGDGDEVILRRGFHEKVFKVVTLKGSHRSFTHAVAEDGTRIDFTSSREDWGRFTGPDGEPWTLYYSFPLPDMSEADRISYAHAMLGEAAPYPRHPTNWWENPIAFLIEKITDDGVFARMASHEAGYLTKNEEDVEELHYKALREAEILATFGKVGDMWLSKVAVKLDPTNLPEWATPGKIVIATSLDVLIQDETTVTTLHNAAVLPGQFTPETVADAFPSRSDRSGNAAFPSLNRRIRLEPVARWKYAAEVSRHSQDSDEALVVVFPDPENPNGGSEHIGILTSRGAVVYSDPSYAHEQFSTCGELMPGIVHATELKPWGYQSHEGEWDSGMDFVDTPASEDTLAHFGLDLAALGALIRGHLDEDMVDYTGMDDQQIARHMMSLNKPVPGKQAIDAAPFVARLG
ncbi:hypothetical protein HFN89_00915 [Rhizobium laguerreae]|nr:hypothetical protein [Rhizobium laguerreae]